MAVVEGGAEDWKLRLGGAYGWGFCEVEDGAVVKDGKGGWGSGV